MQRGWGRPFLSRSLSAAGTRAQKRRHSKQSTTVIILRIYQRRRPRGPIVERPLTCTACIIQLLKVSHKGRGGRPALIRAEGEVSTKRECKHRMPISQEHVWSSHPLRHLQDFRNTPQSFDFHGLYVAGVVGAYKGPTVLLANDVF